MDEGQLNITMRKFLKHLGVTAQQEIEKAVRESGKTSGKVAIGARVTAPDIGLDHEVTGNIDLG